MKKIFGRLHSFFKPIVEQRLPEGFGGADAPVDKDRADFTICSVKWAIGRIYEHGAIQTTSAGFGQYPGTRKAIRCAHRWPRADI
jgi:hypothetical protein